MSSPAIIRMEKVYPHPPAAVWRALTDPELHAKWRAAGDVRPIVGHRSVWPAVLERLGAVLGGS
jgi:uncharacterized protein YndB with AHSA1/START domain